MIITCIILMWSAAVLLAYVFVIYPLFVVAWSRWFPRAYTRGGELADVTVVVVAYNEEGQIAARIQNLLEQDYPPERLSIVLASDGSTDGTVMRARAAANQRVQVVPFCNRRGKPSVLNDIVPTLATELVVFVDVRQRLRVNAVRELVYAMGDPSVGVAGGELMLGETDAQEGPPVAQGVGFYWRYETMIRLAEGTIDSCVGTSGALYAIRRRLFEPIPADTVLDDVLIPMQVVRAGFRAVLVPESQAVDVRPTSPKGEFARKVRTIAGNFQLFSRERWLLSPRENRLWMQTVSHKVMRLIAPPLLVIAFAANVPLAGILFYDVLFVAQLAFYALALGGYAMSKRGSSWRLTAVPYAFCLLNWATVVGFERFLRKSQRVTWERTRVADGSGVVSSQQE